MSSSEQVPDENVERVLDLFTALTRSMGRLQTGEWLGIDLTMQQIKVLFVLWDRGNTSVGNLATSLGVTQPTMTGILDRLVEHGLVRRQESPDDRRLVLNYLTDSAKELAARLTQTKRSQLAKVLRRMSPIDVTLLITALDRLREAAEEEKSIVVPRLGSRDAQGQAVRQA